MNRHSNPRRAARNDVSLPVDMGAFGCGTTRNISRTGMLLEPKRKLPPGGWLMDIELEDRVGPFEVKVRVVSQRTDGVALSIVNIDEGAAQRLRDIVVPRQGPTVLEDAPRNEITQRVQVTDIVNVDEFVPAEHTQLVSFELHNAAD